MRWIVGATTGLLLFVSAAAAEEEKIPFRGELREALDSEGRISIKVPKRWPDKELAEGQILHVGAVGGGGHIITLIREGGQGDTDGMRDRYLEHDSSRFPGCTVKKFSDPYFGYRIDAKAQKRVVVRAFAGDGPDGLILTIVSRDTYYDRHYAAKLAWIAASLQVGGKKTGSSGGAAATGSERVHDRLGKFSFITPPGWKAVDPDDDELIIVAPGGRKHGTRIVFHGWGKSTASLVLTKVASQWKGSYRSARMERLKGTPPRMVVRGRQGESVDYFIGFDDGTVGYTLRLISNEGSFERTRGVADEMAASLVTAGARWKKPEAPEADIHRDHKGALMLHAAAEGSGALDAVGAEYDRFAKLWSRLGTKSDRKAPPLHVRGCTEENFIAFSNRFGEPPVVYDRLARMIVVIAPPKDKTKRAAWKGALAYAFAEATLHRDLRATPPPWFRRGLASCMEAAARSDGKGKGSEEVPVLVGRLLAKGSEATPERLKTVLAWSEGDYIRDETLDKQATAWAYTHLMLFGKGTVPSTYKKWKKSMFKANRRAPKFVLKKYDKEAQDLKAHIAKQWGDRK